MFQTKCQNGPEGGGVEKYWSSTPQFPSFCNSVRELKKRLSWSPGNIRQGSPSSGG